MRLPRGCGACDQIRRFPETLPPMKGVPDLSGNAEVARKLEDRSVRRFQDILRAAFKHKASGAVRTHATAGGSAGLETHDAPAGLQHSVREGQAGNTRAYDGNVVNHG